MNRTNHFSKRAAGFSLIELMVAMVMAFVVLGVLITIYLSSSQSVQFQTSVQRVEENGRFAIDQLSRTIRMAGYDQPLNTFVVDTPVIKGSINSSGALISLPNLKEGADTLSVRYEGGTKIRDCLGNAVAEDTYVTAVFGISTDNNLVCGTSPSNSTPVAEGVEDMILIYGVDSDGDGLPNREVRPGNVTDWSQVVSVRIAILVNSVSNALITPDTVCLGCRRFAGTADRMLRAEFQSTVGIRN
ncbi:MAG: hypothetical protein HKO99_02635 [Xanthomonadales bacterium]|nr:PilW family protein [Gammaproteobacteria bacterium]NNJ78097.1 hypothetical protein [Xanthomonadales bacterium]NNK50474.1 hypothetical protein [Xanthomonadales bacterium]